MVRCNPRSSNGIAGSDDLEWSMLCTMKGTQPIWPYLPAYQRNSTLCNSQAPNKAWHLNLSRSSQRKRGNVASTKSWFSGWGWRQQLFNFQSPAVQQTDRTSSLNCLSCRFSAEIRTKTFIHLNASPLFTEKPFFSLKSASSHPLPQNRLLSTTRRSHRRGLN